MRVAAFALVLLVVLTGCGSGGGGVSMEYDEQFAAQLRELRDREQTRPLKELVPGDWTTVHVILGPHTGEWVEREVGAPLPDSGYGFDTDGDILAFKRGQDVVGLKGTTEHLLGEGYFSADVVLRGESGRIEIDDPNPPAPN